MISMPPIDAAEYARIAVDVASDKFASDVVILDIRKSSDFTDYFVILTGESARQLRNLSDEIEKALQAVDVLVHHIEGTPNSGWILHDYGDVIIHMFDPERREYYNIERAWPESTELLRFQ